MADDLNRPFSSQDFNIFDLFRHYRDPARRIKSGPPAQSSLTGELCWILLSRLASVCYLNIVTK
jgi:hypothetical protein